MKRDARVFVVLWTSCLSGIGWSAETNRIDDVTNAVREVRHRYEALKIHLMAIETVEMQWQAKLWMCAHRNPDRLLPLELLRREPMERHSGPLPDVTPPEVYEGVVGALASRRAQVTVEMSILEQQLPSLTNRRPAVADALKHLTEETMSEIHRLLQQTATANNRPQAIGAGALQPEP